jgi:hypothetical protein
MNSSLESVQEQVEVSDFSDQAEAVELRVLSDEEMVLISGGGRPPNIVWGRGPIIVW